MLISRLMWVYCQQISCDVNDLLIGNYDGHIVLFRITPTPYRWIFTDRMLFLTPNQQCQSTEGNCSTALPQHICEKSTANRNCVLYVLFCSLAVFDARVGHSMDILSPFIPVLCHSDWLFHGNPVHVLMLSIQAVRGLPRLRTTGIVPCIISFSRQLPCFLMLYVLCM